MKFRVRLFSVLIAAALICGATASADAQECRTPCRIAASSCNSGYSYGYAYSARGPRDFFTGGSQDIGLQGYPMRAPQYAPQYGTMRAYPTRSWRWSRR